MHPTLLTTKTQIPPQLRRLLLRTRLLDALERDIPTAKLTLISAPAGYGKSTLLSQWAHASRSPVAWLSLGEDDNDPDRFFRYLLAAWQSIQPGTVDSPFGLLLGALSPPIDATLSAFISLAADLPGRSALVLDDIHLISEPAIHHAVTFLVDHLPPNLHLVLAGRGEPPLPLARYRARHELIEIRAEDLTFTLDESAEFLTHLMALDLAPAEIAPLHAQVEGWVAGLQLVSLTLRRPHAAAERLVVGGRHRFIADYLHDDVLAYVPAPVRRFLLQTCHLDRLSAGLCAAVTGDDDCQATLEFLERENLFLLPLDDRREWFRYHRLFAGVLQEELIRHHPGEITPLHHRAAIWHLDHDLPEPAFRHALTAEDPALVARIVDRYVTLKLFGGETSVVKQWLDAIPAAWYADHQQLGLAQATYLLLTGQFDACARYLDDLERPALAARSRDPAPLARVTAVRCFLACFHNDLPQAEAYAGQALQHLPETDTSFYADIYHALGDTYRGNGRWRDAYEHYRKVLDTGPDPAAPIRSAHVFGALADLDLRQGRLRGAAGYWRRALAAIEEPEAWGRLPLPVTGWIHLRTAELLYEQNDLAAARDHLTRGLERAELGGDVRSLTAGYVIAARLHLTGGDLAAASASLELARPLVEQSPFPEWLSRFERVQLDLWLAQDRHHTATDWAITMLRSDLLPGRPDSESLQLAVARVLIIAGDDASHAGALTLLDDLRQTADAEGRTGVLIEALALHAMAHWQAGDRAGALPPLERALRLAEPEGYVRLFADLGLPLIRLLQEARSRRVMPDYVATLLAASGAGLTHQPDESGLPVEPLSPREHDVLRLIAAGLTNREIAATLSVSPETIKKHTANILAKLGVPTRTAATTRARALHLLD